MFFFLLSRYAILEKAAAKENEKNTFLTVVKSGQNYGNISDVSSENIKGKCSLSFYNRSVFHTLYFKY